MSELEAVQVIAPRAIKMIAQYAFPNGSIIRCVHCGKQRNCSTSEIAEYMTHGFPQCKVCKHKVDLVTPRDQATRKK